MIPGTIAGLFEDAARARPDRPLLKSLAGEIFSVGDVHRLVGAARHWLRDAGVRPDMTVSWQLPAHVPAAVLTLALTGICRRQAPIIHIYRQRDVAAAMAASGADVLIVDSGTAPNAPVDAVVVELPEDWLSQLSSANRHHPPTESEPSAISWIYFTSGSSGTPKAVMHTDTTLLSAANGFRRHLGLGEVSDEVVSIAFPVAHIGGIITLASAIAGGFTALMVPKVDPATLPETLARHRVTVTGGSPTHYHMLLSAQLEQASDTPLIPSLRMLVGGGAACPEELHRAVREHLGIPVVHAYGMTEAAMICVSKHSDTVEQQSKSSGSPIPGVEIRFADDGEIQVRGPNVTPGYLDPGRWAEATTADGWLRSGDCGHFRPDHRLVVTGRLKDMIIRKGENIAPELVEQELLAHPLVDRVAVVGQPDALRGEIVCAVVQRSSRHRDVTLTDLCAFLDERGLMKQMWPERLVIVDEFPVTGLDKVARAELTRQIGMQ